MKKMWGNIAVKRKRALTSSDLDVLFDHYNSGEHDNILFLTIALTCFHALLHLGEMTHPDTKLKHSCKKISWRHTLHLHTDHFTYLLPFHKGDRFFDGNTVLIMSHPTCTCPLMMMRRYVKSRDAKFSLLPELWLTSHSCIPTYSWFVAKLHAVLGSGMAGHSLRSGGATALAIAGVSDDHIQAAGQWVSDSFRVYIRRHPMLLNALIHSQSTQ